MAVSVKVQPAPGVSVAEFGGDAGKLASEILRLRMAMGQAANALMQARAGGNLFFHPR